jgi:DNA-directed RNA polymerase subunit L
MKLVLLEKSNEKLTLEVRDETHTFLNLLRENSWKAGSRQTSYMIEHPDLSQPKLIVRAKNPKKTLDNSAQMIIDQVKEFEKEFKRVVKK